jgi:hypothetical protein
MKAKLIKNDNRYFLTDTSSGWWIGDTDYKKVKAHKGEQILSKLSLKNCQAIELGYNLDELLDNVSPKNGTTGNISERIGFVKGFKKCLELMGDKKFSEKDINTAYSTGYEDGKRNENFYRQLIQSLQQTEWDVTFNPEELDADGCLILKRI